MSLNTISDNFTFPNISTNFNNESSFPTFCTFLKLESIWDFIELFQHTECFRHTIPYTIFLCIVNFIILLFGLLGNILVIYVFAFKLKQKTASSIFILNLAIADLLKILCCIPATLVANLIMPWVFGEIMCKITSYSQGFSVFSSVYSLVAISLDRFRAIHQSVGITPNISVEQAYKIVAVIWALGLITTLPWAIVFQVVNMNPYKDNYSEMGYLPQLELPFCQEVWNTKTQETYYFLLIHVFACFILPFLLITVCNVVTWKSVLGSNAPSYLQEAQRRRKLRLLKMFTGLTLAFFFCWLPLYLIMGRVKLYYTEDFRGSEFEQWIVPTLIPAAQLMGSLNSCVNPVLYALLNQRFRESFKQIFVCTWCSFFTSPVPVATRDDPNNMSVAVIVVAKSQTVNTKG